MSGPGVLRSGFDFRVRPRIGRLEAQDDRGQAQRPCERQESRERQKHMAAFSFGNAASIYSPRQRGELGLTQVPSVAQSPEDRTDAAGQKFVVIGGTATERTVNWNHQVIQSEMPMTAGASGAWVLTSSAVRARDYLAVADRRQKVQSGHGFPRRCAWGTVVVSAESGNETEWRSHV